MFYCLCWIYYGFVILLKTATAVLNELEIACQNGGSAVVTSLEYYLYNSVMLPLLVIVMSAVIMFDVLTAK